VTKSERDDGGAAAVNPFAPISTRSVPRFAGIPTFLRLPVHADPRDLDVMICGAPFDGGTTFRPGARFGPRGVRIASALGRGHHPERGVSLFEKLRCADGGDILCVPMSTERSLANITERIHEIAVAGCVPVMVGGDHTVSLGSLRALHRVHGPLGLIHVDAHSDTFGPAWDVDVHHGTVFRHALREGLLRPSDVLQLGIRGPFTAADDLAFARQAGIRIVMIDEIKRDLLDVVRSIAEVSARGPTYVSFDMDGVDPAYAPGTGTPVPGGLTSYEALQLMRGVYGGALVGADVVELSPDHDSSGITALLAVSVLGEILAALAEARGA
jgi:agmatinase